MASPWRWVCLAPAVNSSFYLQMWYSCQQSPFLSSKGDLRKEVGCTGCADHILLGQRGQRKVLTGVWLLGARKGSAQALHCPQDWCGHLHVSITSTSSHQKWWQHPRSTWLPFLGVSEQHEENPITLLITAQLLSHRIWRMMCWSMLWEHAVNISRSFQKQPAMLRWFPRHTGRAVTGRSGHLCSFQEQEIKSVPLSTPSYNNPGHGNMELPGGINLPSGRGTFRNHLGSQFCYKAQWIRPNLVVNSSMFRLAIFTWAVTRERKVMVYSETRGTFFSDTAVLGKWEAHLLMEMPSSSS